VEQVPAEARQGQMVLARRGQMVLVKCRGLVPVQNDKCGRIVRRLSEDSKLLSASTGIESTIIVARKLHRQGFRGYHLAGVGGPLEEQRSLKMQAHRVYCEGDWRQSSDLVHAMRTLFHQWCCQVHLLQT